jgi:DNA-directed RNA polymerase subunit RPC12/RpoP
MTKLEAKKRAEIVELWPEVQNAHYKDGLSWFQACNEFDCLLDDDVPSEDEVDQYIPCKYCGEQPKILIHKRFAEMQCPNCDHKVESQVLTSDEQMKEILVKKWNEYNQDAPDGKSGAYPLVAESTILDYGLSIRQHYAAIVAAGIVANPQVSWTTEHIAKKAVRITDALLVELNKSE